METIQNTLSEMMELFQNRMAEFEGELNKASITSPTTSGTATEFHLFRTFMMQALNSLQQQVEMLAHGMDNLEMRTRRKILLLHGVTEGKKEDTAAVVTEVVKNRLKVADFTVSDIKRCHRMGKHSSPEKPRPILFKLRDVAVRDSIWFSKTKLKGSGVTVSEFLTKARHDLFLAAREKFGVAKCWTKAGSIYILGPDDKQLRITSLLELNALGLPPEQNSLKPVAGAVKTTTKTRRAAARK